MFSAPFPHFLGTLVGKVVGLYMSDLAAKHLRIYPVKWDWSRPAVSMRLQI
jgi:hypothetical protein